VGARGLFVLCFERAGAIVAPLALIDFLVFDGSP
jgi:hypothetical protein